MLSRDNQGAPRDVSPAWDGLLAASRVIDAVNGFLGRSVMWFILLAILVSAGNAIIRKAFDISSNAWLELQWYLFGWAFLVAAAYTLQRNEHIRIDIISNALPKRVRNWIDILGHAFMLLPFTVLMIYLSWPFFWRAFISAEMSGSAGGLIIWPGRLAILVGFILLFFQAISELIKRIAILQEVIPDPSLTVPLIKSPSSRRGMIGFLIDNMAPIMFAALVVFLLIGYPVAFALSFVGLSFAVLGIELDLFHPTFLQALPDRVWGIMSNETLLAIPFFTFMGLILERSGMAEELLDTAGKLFGPIRGGVAYAVVVVGALLAATTGVVAASVIAMGLISLPIMLRYGYDRRLASGVIAASGTLAQIIPPSLVLIVMADQLGRSVGDMYKGAIIPGLVLTGLYLGYVFLSTVTFPKSAPALPPEARSFGEGADYLPVLTAILLPLVLVVWGMILLFHPPLALDMLQQYMPIVAGWFTTVVTDETRQLLALLLGFAIVYFAYIGLLRFAPRIVCRIIAALMLAASLVLIWRAGHALVEGAAALPPAGDRGLYFSLDVFILLVSEWAYAAGLIAVLAGAYSMFNAPSKPIAAAVWKIVGDFLPPLILIFLVLGTIFQGIATPTEGGAMGALGALVLAIARRRLNFSLMRQALDATTKLSAFVVFILVGARVFSLTFYGVDGHIWVEHLLVSLPGGQIGFLVVVNIVVFLLAFFLDFFELAFIVVPLLAGPAQALGIDLIWFGVLLGINMQTSFMHPPFGFALFYLRSVAPREAYRDRHTKQIVQPVTTGQIYWGAVPFVIIQVIMVGLAIFFPQMIMHYKGVGTGIDPATIEINIPTNGGDVQLPDFGAPQAPDFSAPAAPDYSTPPPPSFE